MRVDVIVVGVVKTKRMVYNEWISVFLMPVCFVVGKMNV